MTPSRRLPVGPFLRRLREEDLPFAMEVKEAAGWNQTLEDWRDLLAWRPEGCFLAELEGAPAGTVTTTVHGGRIGWIGMLLVHPRARRRGVGTALLEAAIESLRGAPEALLDATPAGRAVYEPRGFVAQCDLARMMRPASLGRPGERSAAAAVAVRGLRGDDLDAASLLDAQAFGASRRPLLAAWLRRAPALARLARGPEGIEGFILGRPGARCPHLGPLVASSSEAAAALLASALAGVEGSPVYLDTFTDDPRWLEHLAGLGFAAERSLTRMRLGGATPRADAAGEGPSLYAIAGPEVG